MKTALDVLDDGDDDTNRCEECGEAYEDWSPDGLCPDCRRRARAEFLTDQHKEGNA